MTGDFQTAECNPVEYDEAADTLKIYGIRYSLDLFRGLGVEAVGQSLRIIHREDGVVTVQSLTPGSLVPGLIDP